MKAEERRALRILASAATGAVTLPALTNAKVTERTLDMLASAGFADRRDSRYSNPPGLIVTWCFITAAGRAALCKGERSWLMRRK